MMEVFFNELSVRPASSDIEARQWIETLAELGQSLKLAIESINTDFAFVFRRSEDFAVLPITATQTVLEFLQTQYDFGDAVYIFLLGIFDSPYITDTDPQRTEYEYTSLTFGEKEHNLTGLAAAYMKTALAISFDNDPIWDTCQFAAQINRLEAGGSEISSTEMIEHASQKQHLLNCHLNRIADMFNWATYRTHFDAYAQTQTVLSLVDLYSLHVDSWAAFYHKISQLNERERVASINVMAEQIASVQRWQPATGSLKTQNIGRTIYTIPNSSFIVSVDTQHGEFEIHLNQSGNNHLGSVSFDGKRFKPAATRRLAV
jgi:hypothetical protein